MKADSLNIDSVLVSLIQSGKITYYGWNDTPAWRAMLSSGRIIPLKISGQIYYIDNQAYGKPRKALSVNRYADKLIAEYPSGYPIRTESTQPSPESGFKLDPPTYISVPSAPENTVNRIIDTACSMGIFISAALYIVLVYLKINLAIQRRHEPGTP